jgi:hypothetical protein
LQGECLRLFGQEAARSVPSAEVEERIATIDDPVLVRWAERDRRVNGPQGGAAIPSQACAIAKAEPRIKMTRLFRENPRKTRLGLREFPLSLEQFHAP